MSAANGKATQTAPAPNRAETASSLRQVRGARLGVLAEGGDVDVGRLALLTTAAGVVDRDPNLADSRGVGETSSQQLDALAATTELPTTHLRPSPQAIAGTGRGVPASYTTQRTTTPKETR